MQIYGIVTIIITIRKKVVLSQTLVFDQMNADFKKNLHISEYPRI